ncbi:HAD family hydrolase [Acidaminobacter sp. JC074]|uniref:HAD hydrolase-like protein n=1 Tax=Acidaminobacter sp. JC074 TaxID=2530199 RepID=UPI001F0F2A74|nr:HAD hydrolase-like protein [Acidaminobacter sp. JC074]MCH4889096.1 HAD family hydrolase [Acidaminobacter sp. JC074]
MYNTILFDLDGTITDSAPGITRAAAYALKKYGIQYENFEDLRFFVGPPLIDSFRKYDEISDPMEAVAFFREYYSEKGIFECDVFKGIEIMLKKLKDMNKRLIIATSKPEAFAVKILKHYDLDAYFDFIAGATMDETRIKKSDVIDYALKSNNIGDSKGLVMIGDRHHDIEGANLHHLDSIGVLYGYGDFEELKKAGATYIVKDVNELESLLLK